MFDLKDDGLNLDLINKILSEKEKKFAQLNIDKNKLEIDLVNFLEQAKLVKSVYHMEAEIKYMNALKQDFLVSFNSQQAKKARILPFKHRK
jgi:hypothetical protein